ncbi:MAG: 16S rRNA (cytidine(1402)-2'-O)-methyltransferase [Proteobacteria bacterium]|nr:MAG: 16S rRNA (cytidine(1402)-2'-O)-methyltransferase [Pseudomonadota bacterium]
MTRSSAEAGVLYVVATPIGHLDDMTLRAVKVLRGVDKILCEDTRVTRVLCAHFGITAPLLRHDAHTEARSSEGAVALLAAGEALALVSDAGTPAVSDPGARLVRQVHAAGFRVVPIPGVSALTAALSAAGLGEGAGFTFGGFWPKKTHAARRQLAALCEGLHAWFVPARDLASVAAAFAEAAPAAALAIGRELTKVHETWYRGTPSEVSAQLAADPHASRGEAVLVADLPAVELDDDALRAALQAHLDAGATARDAVAAVATATGARRRRVYQLALSLDAGR